eukprot:CAMPEP_0182420854 /NCGR_PEP_ID=MMETSP1167-20130531/5936_1 /TAXON_ID=2988 /ORGANISM="Mallomonas Sp, Strain CCMP3275" /LENGTH=456 /DNA_ID=CAMNT_0024597357 /DNA_START=268 /DNA_END=1638 /DNA_ORIENTATION=-
MIESKCPPPPAPEIIKKTQHCEELNVTRGDTPITPENGYTFDEIKTLWSCSRAAANFSSAETRLIPDSEKLKKTKWKSVISVDPKSFFDKYLSQYPGDMTAVQPVILFSHKPLDDPKKIADTCKVLDIAIIPDVPGVCVAVTETFHDVASYHMLHADKQSDGKFALTANALEGRDIPKEKHYASARALLLEYFKHLQSVSTKVKSTPKFGAAAVGCLVESLEEVILYKNAVESAIRIKVPKAKFNAFTTSVEVRDKISSYGYRVIYLPELASIGLTGEADVGPRMRRHFLQTWLAFAAADMSLRMIWQSPGTVWLDKPDYVLKEMPPVETLWTYKGRADRRAAPFYCSMDLFFHDNKERSAHLLHELMLHFDLVLAWGSMDAVAAYRLSENNSRYGSTTYIMPPAKVLHTDILGGDAERLRDAVQSKPPPAVIVMPYHMEPSQIISMLKVAGLWIQ